MAGLSTYQIGSILSFIAYSTFMIYFYFKKARGKKTGKPIKWPALICTSILFLLSSWIGFVLMLIVTTIMSLDSEVEEK